MNVHAFRIACVLLCTLVLSLLPGCEKQPEAESTQPPTPPPGTRAVVAPPDGGTATPSTTGAGAAADRKDWPKEIRLGLVPSEGGADIVERFEPLSRFIQTRINHPVRVFSATEYQGIITAMQNDEVEFAYFGPKSYVEAHERAGAIAVIKELNADGEPGYYGIIVSKAGSDIKTIEDARGKECAFVSPSSTSGFLVPALGIFDLTGKTPEEYFSKVIFAGSHGAAMERVAAGDVPVAATNTLDMHSLALAKRVNEADFHVLWKSRLIPASTFACRASIPESLKQAVVDAMLAFNSEVDALQAMGRRGFQKAEDSEFDEVRAWDRRKAELDAKRGTK
jgi:phosphonate transport system substrate-binding protein